MLPSVESGELFNLAVGVSIGWLLRSIFVPKAGLKDRTLKEDLPPEGHSKKPFRH